MAFTETDLTNIENAIVEIASGKRVVSVDTAGKTREFQRVDLLKMMQLRDLIKADIQDAAGSGIINTVSFKNAQ